ncbi:hypothetical protein [Candidatus Regiella insecticola]|nr:hypothetical protein [Candidatus Regiella insecticola]
MSVDYYVIRATPAANNAEVSKAKDVNTSLYQKRLIDKTNIRVSPVFKVNCLQNLVRCVANGQAKLNLPYLSLIPLLFLHTPEVTELKLSVYGNEKDR